MSEFRCVEVHKIMQIKVFNLNFIFPQPSIPVSCPILSHAYSQGWTWPVHCVAVLMPVYNDMQLFHSQSLCHSHSNDNHLLSRELLYYLLRKLYSIPQILKGKNSLLLQILLIKASFFYSMFQLSLQAISQPLESIASKLEIFILTLRSCSCPVQKSPGKCFIFQNHWR